jgi:hypothetical protein
MCLRWTVSSEIKRSDFYLLGAVTRLPKDLPLLPIVSGIQTDVIDGGVDFYPFRLVYHASICARGARRNGACSGPPCRSRFSSQRRRARTRARSGTVAANVSLHQENEDSCSFKEGARLRLRS